MQTLTPDLLLYAYRNGLFPMADPEEDHQIYWYAPDPRGVLPLDGFHIPKNLLKLIRQQRFTVTVNTDFAGVIAGCAAPAPGREQTWISGEIRRAYLELHALGYAHSVETRLNGHLVGGLYGVALRGAFFGESMFHTVTDASKVALVYLVERLRKGGFVLLDTQMQTPHLARFGAEEVSRARYEQGLAYALRVNAHWDVPMNGWAKELR